MMQIVAYLIISIYTIALAYITFYCLVQFHLLIKYLQGRNKRTPSLSTDLLPGDSWPFVTIQLPLYNERYVVERLIDNIVRLKYPVERLEIQILDDSTDITSEICKSKVEQYRHLYNINYLHRNDREGFKAGALKEGLLKASGEFIVIFDADFLPDEDFLLKTIPHFNDHTIGVVQTRWGHINNNDSLLTQLQAFQLNVHFTIEQSGRESAGYLLQFNGTAGVWRKKTIYEAGGWAADTLTEDLDLSLRAQLKGWKIKYIQDIISPAELPTEMSGLKSQQFRWMKGGAENARRLIPAIIKSTMPLLKKTHAITQLLSSSVFLFVFILAIMSVPALFVMKSINIDARYYGIFMIGILSAGVVYYIANKDASLQKTPVLLRIIKFITIFPLFISLSMGLSLHNSIAVLQGYLGKKSVFVRTPKFNTDRGIKKSYDEVVQISRTTIMEGVLALYFLFAIIMGLHLGQTSFIVYHLMLTVGFGSIFFYSVKQSLQR